MPLRQLTFTVLFCFLAAGSACASDAVDFDSARLMAHQRADILKVYSAETAAREHTTESLKSLHGPKVTLEFRQVYGKKHLDMGTLSVNVPPITTPLGAIPVPEISKPLAFEQNLKGPRLAASVEMPIYMGGVIDAKINASQASVYESRADEQTQRDQLDQELAKRYFAVQLARSVEELRTQLLKQQDDEVKKAARFHAAGTISQLEKMAVTVNRDQSYRALLSARTDREVAESQLASYLREEHVGKLSSPLFVVKNDLGSLEQWQTRARQSSPLLRSLEAKRWQADEGVKAAKAAWSPQVYLFGTKNLIKHYLAMTEPNWIAGIGVRMTLWDNRDRNEAIGAARSVVNKAQAAMQEAKNQLNAGIEAAYLRTTQTRLEYESTLSTIELARENLRMRKKAFSEGLSTATELNEAHNQLLAAEITRRVASYRFVVAWATLNALAGTFDTFAESVTDQTNFKEF